jgi:hypothetical protein
VCPGGQLTANDEEKGACGGQGATLICAVRREHPVRPGDDLKGSKTVSRPLTCSVLDKTRGSHAAALYSLTRPLADLYGGMRDPERTPRRAESAG